MRVAVRAGVTSAKAHLARVLAARRAFEAAIAAGDRAAINPEPLLPVVRTLSWARPNRIGESMTITVEDFTTGMVGGVVARDLADAVRAAIWVRWCRRDVEGAP